MFYLRKVSFLNNQGNALFFDENGDPPALYDLIRWVPLSTGGIKFSVVGYFDSSVTLMEQLKVKANYMWGSDGDEVCMLESKALFFFSIEANRSKGRYEYKRQHLKLSDRHRYGMSLVNL